MRVGDHYGIDPGFSGSYADAFAVSVETDDQLRARLLYVAGDGRAQTERIHQAQGHELDDLAAQYNLQRRTRK